jgi:hypothetical protein
VTSPRCTLARATVRIRAAPHKVHLNVALSAEKPPHAFARRLLKYGIAAAPPQHP